MYHDVPSNLAQIFPINSPKVLLIPTVQISMALQTRVIVHSYNGGDLNQVLTTHGLEPLKLLDTHNVGHLHIFTQDYVNLDVKLMVELFRTVENNLKTEPGRAVLIITGDTDTVVVKI